MNTTRKFKLDGLIVGTFLTTLFYSATFPYIYKEIMGLISNRTLSVINILSCLAVAICGTLWNKYSDKLFKSFTLLCKLEMVGFIILGIFVTMNNNMVYFYYGDSILYFLFTRNIACGYIKLKCLRYEGESREKFDNSRNTAEAIAKIIGLSVAIFITIPIKVMLWIGIFGAVIDNIIYMSVYNRTVKLNIEN